MGVSHVTQTSVLVRVERYTKRNTINLARKLNMSIVHGYTVPRMDVVDFPRSDDVSVTRSLSYNWTISKLQIVTAQTLTM